jgi:HAD superfamily phosphoserine phosphatase-like hydrolase
MVLSLSLLVFWPAAVRARPSRGPPLPRAVRALLHRLDQQKSPQKRFAVFDADHTLWNRDVGVQFQKWMARRRYFPRTAQPRLARAWRRYRSGKLSGLSMFKLAVTGMAGMQEARVRELAARYWDRGFGSFEGQIFRPMKVLVRELQRRGVDVYIVSASNPWLVAEGARRLGIDESHVIGMGVEVKGGRLTDRLTRPVPWEAGKVEAIRARIGAGRPVLVAGDSTGDLAMLGLTRREQGDVSMIVNAHRNPAVHAAARQNGWARATFDAHDTLGVVSLGNVHENHRGGDWCGHK